MSPEDKTTLCALLTLALMGFSSPSGAVTRLFDPASYGTGVYVGNTSFPNMGSTRAFDPLSETDTLLGTYGVVRARAQADFQGFDLGAEAIAHLDLYPGSFLVVQGGAIAYTGLLTSDETPTILRGSVTLEGTIYADPAHSYPEVDLAIWDIYGGLRSIALLYGDAYTQSEIQYCPTRACGPSTDFVHVPVSSGAFTSGSVPLPFSLPVYTDNGIIVELLVRAFDNTQDFKGVDVDFMDTASLTFDSPPGVTVTLATGQVFVGAVPEPATATLLAPGLIIVASMGLRRSTKMARSPATQ